MVGGWGGGGVGGSRPGVLRPTECGEGGNAVRQVFEFEKLQSVSVVLFAAFCDRRRAIAVLIGLILVR